MLHPLINTSMYYVFLIQTFLDRHTCAVASNNVINTTAYMIIDLESTI